jgi:twitching motility protein PilT
MPSSPPLAFQTASLSASKVSGRLPASFYDILSTVPADLFGEPRARLLAEGIARAPEADVEKVRNLYRSLVRAMIELNASDMDIGGPAGRGAVWYRVDGFKRPFPEVGSFSVNETDMILLAQIHSLQQETFFQRNALDFGYSLEMAPGEPVRRFRTTLYYDNRHLALSARLLAWKPRTMRSLGFHPAIERGLMFNYVRDGLTLVTGVTGSGKSTTLDAIIDANNESNEAHILIIAQPLEYIHESKRCIVRHREVGTDVRSFVDGMVQALRQDPDIVVVGEMRDPETIESALEMADTGHKVFSTLHTGSAVETIDRIVAEYSADEQERVRNRLADVLRCVISQKLVPTIGGGRVLAKEVLWLTSAAKAAIKNNNTGEIYQMIWEGAEQGMITLEQDLMRLVQIGDISPDVALSYANNKRRLLQILR